MKYLLAITLFMFSTVYVMQVHSDARMYKGEENIYAQSKNFIAQHNHNWDFKRSATGIEYIPRFGEENNFSTISWFNSDGSLLFTRPTSALSWIGFSENEKYLIGLSNIKVMNDHQLVVYSNGGDLIHKQRIYIRAFCLPIENYNELIQKYDSELNAYLKYVPDESQSDLWFDESKAYLWTGHPLIAVMRIKKVKREMALCRLPWATGSFRESTSNFIQWFDSSSPKPKLVMLDDEPVGIVLRDLLGTYFEIPFYTDTYDEYGKLLPILQTSPTDR